MKRRGNRRYYQHHEVLMVRRIRELLYDRASPSGRTQPLRAHAGEEATSGRVDAVAAAPADANLQTQLLLDQLLRQEPAAQPLGAGPPRAFADSFAFLCRPKNVYIIQVFGM
jgi:DNA-binding transcriptional MerR regulator